MPQWLPAEKPVVQNEKVVAGKAELNPEKKLATAGKKIRLYI